MGIYCSHMIFLRPGIAERPVRVAVAWLVALGGSVVLTLLLQRIPYVRSVLLGERPSQRKARATW